ncbi:TetR family transcriptional regulator [Kineothrix alysoides]|uniref:TetR family transcriptional regulator n=1 Tax=Kineothrix alysoides TaxID=1469948 RepID=A0A4R1QW23_9FIRM|nr:TetR/AcrR family transcriptional regulator [Kineothrix alysoides]TCL55214.1 TetR family transcriptional regulator [Kineothrix alysoides]
MPKSPERCEEIRTDMRNKILHKSILYFAKNGFSGTKISDLSKYIGIGQGTIYVYFESKDKLFQEIHQMINREKDISQIKLLANLPIPAKQKIHKLTKEVLRQLEEDDLFAGMIALNTQILLEQNGGNSAYGTTYQSELYKYMTKIIEQGQKEGSIVSGNSLKLADYYWGVVYLYSLKRLFTTKYEIINSEDLERTVLKQ